MPPWLFVLLLLLIIVLIAAAIIVPVELIVVPRQNAKQDGSVVDVSTCQSSHACQNGGFSVVYNGSCSCACINGFAGTSCQNGNDPACAGNTADVSGPLYANLTLGMSIPSIIGNSQENYGINLNVTALAGAFSLADLRCEDESALVTFLPYDKKRSVDTTVFNVSDEDDDAAQLSTPANLETPSTTPAPSLGQVRLAEQMRQQITSDSIILDNTSTYTVTESATKTSAAPAATSTNNGASPAVTGFAQVAVLWILQETDDQTARSARSLLDSALNAPTFTPSAITVASGVVVNLASGVVSTPDLTEGTGTGINQTALIVQPS